MLPLVLSLSEDSDGPLTAASAIDVGGKALGLRRLRRTFGSEHVPAGLVLTTAFFRPWSEAASASKEWTLLLSQPDATDEKTLEKIKAMAKTLPLTSEQTKALASLRESILGWPGKVAAVRSSAPEEDGKKAAFAGMYETKLGVAPEGLEGGSPGMFCVRLRQAGLGLLVG